MKPVNRTADILTLLITSVVCSMAVPAVAHAQNAPATKDPIPSLIQRMAGTWSVEQRMWPAAAAKPVNLPPATARRRLVQGAFLEETMELAAGSKEEPFTRVAYFNYNAVNQQCEYFSLDTRAPQMMLEKSYEAPRAGKTNDRDGVILYGGSFVAPRWGDATNVAFRYRLTAGEIEKDRQAVQLYLTPQSGEKASEFLAFEYIYTRQR